MRGSPTPVKLSAFAPTEAPAVPTEAPVEETEVPTTTEGPAATVEDSPTEPPTEVAAEAAPTEAAATAFARLADGLRAVDNEGANAECHVDEAVVAREVAEPTPAPSAAEINDDSVAPSDGLAPSDAARLPATPSSVSTCHSASTHQ